MCSNCKVVSLTLLLLLVSTAPCYATDFQMPASVATADEGAGTSKKSIVSKGTFNLLKDVQKSLDAGNSDEAFEKLNKLIQRVSENAYETAVVLKTAGYIHAQRDEAKLAIPILEHAVKMKVLAPENQQKIRYDLSQLLMSLERYLEAQTYLEGWHNNSKEEDVTPSSLARMGSNLLRLERSQEAEKYLNMAAEKGKFENEHHLRLLLAAQQNSPKTDGGISTLKRLIALKPDNKQYYLQLTGLYDQIGEAKHAASALLLSFEKGLLEDSPEVTELAFRLIEAGVPLKAAKVLEKGLKNFVVWVTPENLNLLAHAYMQAKQPERAIPWLEKAVLTSKSNQSALTLSELYRLNNELEKSLQSLAKAADMTEGSQKIDLLLNLAIRQESAGKLETAIKTLQDIGPDIATPQQRKQIEEWQAYLSNKKQEQKS